MSKDRNQEKPEEPVEEKPTQHPHGKKLPGEDVKKPIQENPGEQNTG